MRGRDPSWLGDLFTKGLGWSYCTGEHTHTFFRGNIWQSDASLKTVDVSRKCYFKQIYIQWNADKLFLYVDSPHYNDSITVIILLIEGLVRIALVNIIVEEVVASLSKTNQSYQTEPLKAGVNFFYDNSAEKNLVQFGTKLNQRTLANIFDIYQLAISFLFHLGPFITS